LGKNIWTSTNSEFVESKISFLNDIAKKEKEKKRNIYIDNLNDLMVFFCFSVPDCA